MKTDDDNVFYLIFDDPPPYTERSITQREVDQTTEETWSDVKNSLQDFLWRTENTENPAFPDQTIFTWIDQNAEKFDQFYKEKRTTTPKQLLDWWKQSQKSDSIDVPEFILEWVAFKNRADTTLRESVAA